MSNGILRPTSMGGTISAVGSASLAAMDASGLPLGTQIWNIAVGAFFKLTTSNAALSPDAVVAVLGVTGQRWIVVSISTGTVQSVTAATANGVNNSDAANPVINDASAANAGFMSAAAFSGLPVDVAATGTLPGSTLGFGTLDGDADGDYEIEYDLKCLTNAPGLIVLKVNGAATNQSCAEIYNFAGVGGTTLDPGLGIWNSGATGRITGMIRLTSKTGQWRVFNNMASDGTPNSLIAIGNFKDTATNITGLTIVAANANAFDAGSAARLRKLHKA